MVEDYVEGEADNTSEQILEQGGMESSEEAFMRGYSNDEEIEECSECGSAIEEEKFTKIIDGETHVFCSKVCAEEFEEGMK